MKQIRRLFEIPPSSDPDDARRKKLLNVLLVSIFILTLIALIAAALYAITGGQAAVSDVQLILYSGPFLLVIVGLIFVTNRIWSGQIASSLFLLLLLFLFVFTDTPQQVANGRSLFVFSIPIAISSLLLRPDASFLLAALSSIEISILAITIGIPPNITAIVGFFLLAMVSFLSSRSLENALKEVRQTIANLDRLVQARTQELAEALSRVRIEAGRSNAILESIADGVIVFDLNEQAIIANLSSVRLLEIPSAKILGAKLETLSQDKVLDLKSQDILANLLSSSRRQSSSHRIQWGKKTLSVTSAPVFDTESHPIGTVAVFRDYTHEAELDRMKDTFLAIVSHELRTPLNAILGYAEMMKEAVYGPVNEKQSRASERILSNTRRLLDIVSDLLDQSQIQAGKMTIHYKEFRPVELIYNVDSVMDKIAKDKGLDLKSELDPALPEQINGDMARLQQILINLINNSIKFTEKGSIHVRLYKADRKHWAMEVRDTGIGISEEELPHIFDAFWQGEDTAIRRRGGFGIGLSIVKQLAGLMNGDLTMNSIVGEGSTFTVKLPLISEGEEEVSELALVIEDDEDLASIFSDALQAADFEVETIRDGLMAQERLSQIEPHVVLLDLHLPGISGGDLLTQIRSDARLKNTVVVLATADPLLGDTYSDSADFVLVKPIAFTQLRDLTARLHRV